MADLELKIDILKKIAEHLNSLIRTSGKIKLNDRNIWCTLLHRMDNEVWRGVLETLQDLSEQHIELFESYHLIAIEKGLAALDRYEKYYDKVLDIKNKSMNNKKITWQCLMTIREVYNASIGLDLPNEDYSIKYTKYENLFEIDDNDKI